ncbi:hypothetical protein [Neisseria chenwenguii]|nr:hypothetical protein [Neisseria chenwenguii]
MVFIVNNIFSDSLSDLCFKFVFGRGTGRLKSGGFVKAGGFMGKLRD